MSAFFITEYWPDILILDISFQAKNEQYFTQTYRIHCPHGSIIGWGTNAAAEARAYSLEVTEYLHKPFDLNDLPDLLVKHSRQ